jgi:4-diphosphocytidyl-2-C-methyl-D-erythritol kinase
MFADTAWAKVNLALHVRRRRPDGYHDIETLVAFAADGDRLTVAPADRLTLVVTGPFAAALGDDHDDNLVLRAARALADATGVATGAALTLDKRLPVASGIGGGSADAAAALRLLARLWRVDLPAGLAMTIGADVPACVASITARGEGRGEQLEALGDGLAGWAMLLVNPGVAVSTAQVFAGWDGIDRGPLAAGDPLLAAAAGRNDLEPPARVLAPAIDAVLTLLAAQSGAELVRMSGSGATCFALFDSVAARDAADLAIARQQPDWWRLATALRS